ncbi:MAG: hypothetical protein ACE5IK_06880 [Acidobacteriota bacterium]
MAIHLLQVCSIVIMWVFLLTVVGWIVHLVRVARELRDAQTASLAISLVAIPVYMLVAGVLTYVFFGLRRGAFTPGDDAENEDHET